MNIFPGQGKVKGILCFVRENFERTLKVRERSGNLKISDYTSFHKKYSYCIQEERMYVLER